MFSVSDVVELMLVFGLFFAGLAILYYAQKWMDRQADAADAADDED